MKLRITGWQSENMRCANATLKFNTHDNVDFIQMNNGTGKTTTLNLIRLALTGEKNISLIDEKSEKMNPLSLAHGLLMSDKDHGKFILKTLINDVSYDFIIKVSRGTTINDSIEFETSSDEIGGINPGWRPPVSAQAFLTNEFVQLFVFDGERQGRILNEGDSYAKKTISTLCQFNILEEGLEQIKNYVDEISEHKGKGDDASLKRFINLKEEARKHLELIQEERNNHFKKLEQNKKEYKELHEKYKAVIEKDKKNKSKNEKFIKDIDKNRNDIKELQKESFQAILNVNNVNPFLHEHLNKFKNSMDLLKLPDNVARQFFNELSVSKYCVCKREIGDAERKAILENAENYLSDDVTGILNSIKKSIESNSVPEINLNDKIESLKKLDHDAQILDTQYNQFKLSLTEHDEELKANLERYGELKEIIKNEELLLTSHYDAPADADEVQKGIIQQDLINIKTIQAILKKRQDKIDEYSGSVKLRKQYNLLEKIVKKTLIESSEKIFKGMIGKVQDKIDEIMKEENPRIIIENIGNYVKLQNRDGLSSGQKLATAYSFMSAALEYSNINVPFIIDSPTGSLDFTKRSGVGKMLPLVTHQLIPFLTPAEKASFVSHIRKAANNKCSHTTIFWLNKINKDWINERKTQFKNNELELFEDQNFGIVKGDKWMDDYNLAAEAEEE